MRYTLCARDASHGLILLYIFRVTILRFRRRGATIPHLGIGKSKPTQVSITGCEQRTSGFRYPSSSGNGASSWGGGYETGSFSAHLYNLLA